MSEYNFKSREEQWKYYGLHLGYPLCCVEAFLRGEQVHSSIFSGTGFLPCKECNKLPVSEVLNYIDTHRKDDTIFPFDGYERYNKSTAKEFRKMDDYLRQLP